MNKANINLAILFIIVVMVCVLIKRYNKLDQTEHFTANNELEPSTTVAPPDSTYNLQQYIETNPPTGSQVIKREISHTLPDVIDKDMVMRDGSQIRFGSMRGEAGSDSDNWHFQGISHASEPHLKMVLGDAENKNSSFQIHGGACEVDSNCSADGRKLFDFDSQPNFEMYDRTGQKILHANQHGDLECNRDLKVNRNSIIEGNQHVKGSIITDSNSEFKAGLQVNGSTDLKDTFVRGGLQILDGGNLHATGPLNIFNGNVEVRNDLEAKQSAKIDGTMHAGTVNSGDANVRRRLYFSDAGKPGRNWKEIVDHGSGNYDSAHHSDVVYIEKRTENEPARGGTTEGKLTTLVIKLSDDRADGLEIIGGPGGNNKLMRLDGNGNLYIKGDLHVSGGTHSNYGVSGGGFHNRGRRDEPHFTHNLGRYVTRQTTT